MSQVPSPRQCSDLVKELSLMSLLELQPSPWHVPGALGWGDTPELLPGIYRPNHPISRGIANLSLWPRDKWHHFLEVCLCRWRTTSSAAATIAPRLLPAPRNASDARTPQERALIFLRQLCSPYKTVYCANNKCEAYLQSQTLAD